MDTYQTITVVLGSLTIFRLFVKDYYEHKEKLAEKKANSKEKAEKAQRDGSELPPRSRRHRH